MAHCQLKRTFVTSSMCLDEHFLAYFYAIQRKPLAGRAKSEYKYKYTHIYAS